MSILVWPTPAMPELELLVGGGGGVIPGMVKLSEGVLVNLHLVFPF